MTGIVIVVLWVAVLYSAISLVTVRHEARNQFIALQQLVKQRDALLVEWGQLQIEQSTFATHARIDRLAREKLKLKQPLANDIVIVKAK
ncbi:MAG: cell division protein FtsL [Gammaproteobacteria bacterium]|nr:cell division protein FtsL [Gammaproteobacteria bacterium]NNC97324.1 cell division protein FtsL [Gammaproteobacteria bacterium]NNM14652.1 cell division protein FtsL [Gammaproteobacteria bacterium]